MLESISIFLKSKIVLVISTNALTLGLKVAFDRFSLNHKLKKEFYFEQKKQIKQEIAKTKTPLLNSCEELNYRLWNFNINIGKNWHKTPMSDWASSDVYYLRSYVYRLLVFFYWILKTEKDLTHYDATIADKKDLNYLMYIKTFKNIFCDTILLKSLNYDANSDENHFYKNNLQLYADYVKGDNDDVIDFDTFSDKIKNDLSSIEKVFKYINDISNNDDNKNLNVIRCFHLILIKFLSSYGHDYHKTEYKKLNRLLIDYYKKIKIKDEFIEFLKRNKMKGELKYIILKINSKIINYITPRFGDLTKKNEEIFIYVVDCHYLKLLKTKLFDSLLRNTLDHVNDNKNRYFTLQIIRSSWTITDYEFY
ncbi:hypothetical protein K5X82_15760 [Halosquirtibacter xylanolyticus]|uniref:hypothetical protein n=1 Tax=Halosquirtibacter xylanolyticus TaxID=3374599 RepID=UPI00374793CC|nr:hypothetical protein K5X82_15760 [Prolixibacteraceae bacterium]